MSIFWDTRRSHWAEVLAAGVVSGAIAGHGVATVIAVLGGSVMGQYLSERVVQYLGGILFLVFAAATAFDLYTGMQ